MASPEFSFRAVLTGMILAAVLAAGNLYVGLKIGTPFGMSLIAVLLGYGFWQTMRVVLPGHGSSFGILENNISQTACSAGASVASAGLVAPIPALAMMTNQTLSWPVLALWMMSVMLVGIVIAIPLRRQLIVEEKLPFVSGVACAEMLRELHERGKDAVARIGVFFGTALLAVAYSIVGVWHALPSWPLPITLWRNTASALTFTFAPSFGLFGIGGLIGIRIATSLLAGAVAAYLIVAPVLVETRLVPTRSSVPTVTIYQIPAPLSGIGTIPMPMAVLPDPLPPATTAAFERVGIRQDAAHRILTCDRRLDPSARVELESSCDNPLSRAAVVALYEKSQSAQPSFRDVNAWLLWPGITLMVLSSLTALVFSWRSIGSTFRGMGLAGRGDGASEDRGLRLTGLIGFFVAVMVLAVVLQSVFFGIAWWVGTIGVLLSFLLAVVAARVSGETGMNPIGAMGKLTQLFFGAVVPKNPVPNLMAANVTGGAASQCADLLSDLKCGHLLGATPAKQVWAQICGALVGALAGSAIYRVLIPDPAALPTDKWPVPAAMTWKAVAELFARGREALPAGAMYGIIPAAAAAILLTVLERGGPKRWRGCFLSPVSIGLAMILPASLTLPLFVGGLTAWILGRWFKNWTARFLVAACAGMIMGESMTEIGIQSSEMLKTPVLDFIHRVLGM